MQRRKGATTAELITGIVMTVVLVAAASYLLYRYDKNKIAQQQSAKQAQQQATIQQEETAKKKAEEEIKKQATPSQIAPAPVPPQVPVATTPTATTSPPKIQKKIPAAGPEIEDPSLESVYKM